jgi:hypothetical protein
MATNMGRYLENLQLVYCPVAGRNAIAEKVNGSFTCRACEQVENSNGSDFHEMPR